MFEYIPKVELVDSVLTMLELDRATLDFEFARLNQSNEVLANTILAFEDNVFQAAAPDLESEFPEFHQRLSRELHFSFLALLSMIDRSLKQHAEGSI
ncbi:hypothetical protein Dform_01839 [Dehalogenimonas formicexedens]|uniref:Uncharacterized protein n=1 Tax=Dehalogenimonas formicexedens TaxID=1839801 RepID=A0A1P8F9P0_9CHLR|nr:hypothetical protein [Dehalogenimonas formicexedens]APV45158.1 hypothetical protein Dform_01839 [Dehalogenimonas formicexedens]